MELAKPALDVGLYTNSLVPMLSFWQSQPGVTFSELLPVGGGVRQHRHAVGESILKINHSREVLPTSSPSGLSKLCLFPPDSVETQQRKDPDGNALILHRRTPKAPNLRLVLAVNDIKRSAEFYGTTLALPQVTHRIFAVGASEIELIPGQVESPRQKAIGYRYMTFQVFDVVAEHDHVLARGGSEGMAPVRLGEVAYISFVLDPDGNWIELSQRKSITGSLA